MTTSGAQIDYRPFPKLTKEFVAQRMRVGWKDLAWAASNHWLDTKALGELADGLVKEPADDLRAELAIAAGDGDAAALKALIDQQARGEMITDERVRDRWMRIAVAWLYQHREVFDDPWAVIEEIWEAFDHAPALNGLIRWMPAPADGKKPGMESMLERWQEFVSPEIS